MLLFTTNISCIKKNFAFVSITVLHAITGVIHYANPFTPKIELVILLTVCHTILMMLVWRIWCLINQ